MAEAGRDSRVCSAEAAKKETELKVTADATRVTTAADAQAAATKAIGAEDAQGHDVGTYLARLRGCRVAAGTRLSRDGWCQWDVWGYRRRGPLLVPVRRSGARALLPRTRSRHGGPVAVIAHHRMQVRRRLVAAFVGGLLCTGLLAPVPVRATPGAPTAPSAAAVRRAHAAAAAAAVALAHARTDATSAQARLDALDTEVEQAVEAWNGARADADEAAAALTEAQADADVAQANARSAQNDVDRLAVASYQVGADLSGGLGEFAAVVDSAFRPGGITNLTDRMTQVGQVAADRRHGIDDALALRLLAAQAQAAAAQSSVDLAARESAVAAATDGVRALQASQQSEVVRLTARRDAAATVLAHARTATSTLESARAEALRRAAAARAAAARAAAAAVAARRALEHRASGGHPPSDTGGSPRAWPDGASTSTRAQRFGALAFAKTQLGKPYVAGEHGPDSYDCSGLTSAAYAQVGVAMIQYSQTQFARGLKIPVSALQPGDLVFFATDPSDWLTIHHVGIYAGGGQMVEAPHTGDHVKFQTIWQDELMAYGARP